MTAADSILPVELVEGDGFAPLDLSVVSPAAVAPPVLPLDALPPPWPSWIETAAKAANAAPDNVLLPLLVAAAGAIGNARWVAPAPGWAEPPALWGCVVGEPSAGKSRASAPVFDAVRSIESELGAGFDDERRQWEARAADSEAARERWRKECKEAAARKAPAPEPPAAADPPPEPVPPRLVLGDTTPERLVTLAAGLPRGFIVEHDELAGWFRGFGRYAGKAGGGPDRAMWLSAWGGRPYTVDRVKDGGAGPVTVPRLTVGLFGTTQPARLAELLRQDDDGMVSRLLFAWPEPMPFRLGDVAPDVPALAAALRRLVELPMPSDSRDRPYPRLVPFERAAREDLEAFGRAMQVAGAEAGPLLGGWYGKARGHAVRLALVLEYLGWSAGGSPEPVEIRRPTFLAAADLVAGYFAPMAARCFADAAVPERDQRAATLARAILRRRAEIEPRGRINLRDARRSWGLHKVRGSAEAGEAAAALVEAGWLKPIGKDTSAGIRPRVDYAVNPALWEAGDAVA